MKGTASYLRGGTLGPALLISRSILTQVNKRKVRSPGETYPKEGYSYGLCVPRRGQGGELEHFGIAGWREDAGFVLFHFPTWAKARAMQHWIDRSGIAHRPMPRLGETPQEREERKREALAWGLETGAVHAVVQAYRGA